MRFKQRLTLKRHRGLGWNLYVKFHVTKKKKKKKTYKKLYFLLTTVSRRKIKKEEKTTSTEKLGKATSYVHAE